MENGVRMKKNRSNRKVVQKKFGDNLTFLPAKSLLVPKPKPALNHALSLTFLLKQLAGGGGILYS